MYLTQERLVADVPYAWSVADGEKDFVVWCVSLLWALPTRHTILIAGLARSGAVSSIQFHSCNESKVRTKVQQVQKLYEVKVKILFLFKSSHKLLQLSWILNLHLVSMFWAKSPISLQHISLNLVFILNCKPLSFSIKPNGNSVN
jgi:hypothetical protein